MTPEGIAALERDWLREPGDLRAAEQLLLINQPDPGLTDVTERDKRARLRRAVILWLIEHHPEHIAHRASFAQFSTRANDPRLDPEGYRTAAQRWQQQTAPDTATAATLRNAAYFFSAGDPPRAEALLLRAQQLDPRASTDLLGQLYADVIDPPSRHSSGKNSRNADAPPADATFVAHVRRQLAETTDANLLASAGSTLAGRADTPERQVVAAQFLTRARELPRKGAATQVEIVTARIEAMRRISELLRDRARDSWPEAVAALPIDERLRAMTYLATSEYSFAEYNNWEASKPAPADSGPPALVAQRRANARDGWRRSKLWANQTLDLAAGHRQSAYYADAFFHSHVVLAINALRDGDHQAALRHLDLASTAPPPDLSPADAAQLYVPSLEDRLIKWLLKDGERETVIAYFEQLAASDESARARLQRAATDLREGIQPIDYLRAR